MSSKIVLIKQVIKEILISLNIHYVALVNTVDAYGHQGAAELKKLLLKTPVCVIKEHSMLARDITEAHKIIKVCCFPSEYNTISLFLQNKKGVIQE